MREWQEETGLRFPDGVFSGAWESANGIYQGFVYTIPREADLDIFSRLPGVNPDDPDGDAVEVLAWMDPADLPGNPAIRPELLAGIDAVMAALGCDGEPGDVAKCAFCPACGGDWDESGTCMDWVERGERARRRMGVDGTPGDAQDIPHPFAAEGRHATCAACWLAEDASVHQAAVPLAKAGGARPKGADWPGWKLDLQTAAHWGPKVTAAAQATLTRPVLADLAAAYIAAHPGQDGDAPGKRDRNAAAAAWLASRGVTVPFGDLAEGIAADGYMIGAASAHAMVQGQGDAGTGGWQPGDSEKARELIEALGAASALATISGGGGSGPPLPGIAQDMSDGYVAVVARVLAGWDPAVAAGELADMVEEAVADGAYAEALAVTQITAYSGQAALDYYLANTQSLLSWLAVIDGRTCPRCLENASAAPRRAGETWPSGDVAPPAHPGGCRCALGPADL